MDTYAHNKVTSVSIRNFKSIRNITLKDCRRINVLIGRPNVGKSNILEALALFDIPYMIGGSGRSLKNFVRVENVSELFHNGDASSPSVIEVGDDAKCVARASNNGLVVTINVKQEESSYTFTPTLNLLTKREPTVYPDILTYFFPKQFVAESSGIGYLLPPSGCNLMSTVSRLPELKADMTELFHKYGLKMMFDVATGQIKAMKESGNDMFLVPFTSLADSLQRLMFYKAAIHSVHDMVLCFEEPEAHTFPPYISSVVNDILSSADNQFFITTHSPYVLGSLLEDAGSDLAVFVVDVDSNSTVVRRLTEDEMQNVYDCGMDMFYNIEALLEK